MSSRIIEITVSPAGKTHVETKGFTGSECRDASRFLEQALGQKQEERLTADFYRQASAETQQNRQRS
jgi:hypothetical protein